MKIFKNSVLEISFYSVKRNKIGSGLLMIYRLVYRKYIMITFSSDRKCINVAMQEFILRDRNIFELFCTDFFVMYV